MTFPLRKIISGGQTGADRAGLAAARQLGIKTGGCIPKGFRTDLGSEPELGLLYGLVEHPSASYTPRTRLNVQAADGTVLFGNMASPGSRLTIQLCEQFGRPYLVNPTPERLRRWVCVRWIEILNVAGNRERTNPGVYFQTARTIVEAFHECV